MDVLRTLICSHGLKTEFIEGLTDAGTLLLDARVAAFKKWQSESGLMPVIARMLAVLRADECQEMLGVGRLPNEFRKKNVANSSMAAVRARDVRKEDVCHRRFPE
jgi:hypothetical protein